MSWLQPQLLQRQSGRTSPSMIRASLLVSLSLVSSTITSNSTNELLAAERNLLTPRRLTLTAGCNYLGSGHCPSGYLKGWDGKGDVRLEDCLEICRLDSQCGYVSFCPRTNPQCEMKLGKGSCSRYQVSADCQGHNLKRHDTAARTHETYKVQDDCNVATSPKYTAQEPQASRYWLHFHNK